MTDYVEKQFFSDDISQRYLFDVPKFAFHFETYQCLS